MPETVEELVVKVSPDGTEETTQSLDNVDSQFEQTAQKIGDSADEMDSFAERWQGAMTAIVAGLAIGAAGLLSKVPVINELMSGLNSVITALAFKMDSALRPALSKISKVFFNVADAIFQADGKMGKIIGTVAGVVSALAAGIASVLALSSAFSAVSGAITTVLGLLTGPVIAIIAVLTAAIIGLALAWKNNWFDIKSIVANVWESIQSNVNLLIDLLFNLVTFVTGVLKQDWEQAWRSLKNVVKIAVEIITNIIGANIDIIVEMVKVGLNLLLEAFVVGFRAAINVANKFANGLITIFDKLLVRIRSRADTFKDLLINAFKIVGKGILGVFDTIANGFIELINSSISALERLINAAAETAKDIPGLTIERADFDRLQEVDTSQNINVRSGQEIIRQGAQRRRRRLQKAEQRSEDRSKRFERGLNRLVKALRGAKLKTELNFDGREIATDIEQLIGKEPADSGRTASE